ncbi:response regulator transcription factor [Ligilactobacillus sp. LYQ135]
MEDRLILITQKLPLFMKLNTYCNDHGWMVYNTTEINDVMDFIQHKHVAGIIWDLDATDKTETLPFIKKIRETFNKPILTLTSQKDFDYEMQLFSLHVDEYLVEPYEYEEVIVRLQQAMWSRAIQTEKKVPELFEQELDIDDSILDDYTDDEIHQQKSHHPKHHHIKLDDLLLDIDHYRVLKNGEDLGLTPKEFKLLYFLVKNKGQVLSREQLLEGVWDYNDLGTSRIVDIHISHLRDKIEPDPQHPKYIKTIRGFGYSFEGKPIRIKKDNKN